MRVSLPAWVLELRDRIPTLLKSYAVGPPGWYRLCTSGDLLAPGPKAGLGFSCYAAKVMVQCRLWEHLQEEHRTGWVRHIQNFQLGPEPPGYGQFCDPWVESHGRFCYNFTCLRGRRWGDLFRVNWQNRWAETRQAVATLKVLGAQPRYPIGGFPTEPESISQFIQKLDWRQPWGAGAQVGHLLFFMKHGEVPEAQRTQCLETVLDGLAKIESSETGFWHQGKVPNQEIINGAMKVLSGLKWWGIGVRQAESLARIAVADVVGTCDCAVTNRLFVLHCLKDQLESLPTAVEPLFCTSLEFIHRFLQPDGGLSSSPTGSLSRYYYAKVSQGLPLGDLHGLCLLTWAIALGAGLTNQLDLLGWQIVAP